jgi:hypothetical protein
MRLFGLAVLCGVVLAFGRAASAAELQVGDMAPDFTLRATDGRTSTMWEFRDKQPVYSACYRAP